MNKKLKFSLYLRPNEIDGCLDYEVIGAKLDREVDGVMIYTGFHDTSKTTKLVVRLRENNGHDSHLLIEKLIVNDIELKNIENWSCYICGSTGKKLALTHGWVSQKGDYILKIRQNPLVFNYLNWFYDTCREQA